MCSWKLRPRVSVGLGRTEIVVGEHAPGANHLDALGRVSLDQKVVSHRRHHNDTEGVHIGKVVSAWVNRSPASTPIALTDAEHG